MTTQAMRSLQRIGIAMLAIVSLLAAIPAIVHGASATYEYDVKGRVSKITYNDGTVIDYTYDLNGNRTGATTTTPAPDTTPPTAPGTPTFSNITMTSATASWTAATDNKGVVGYDYKVNAGSWQSLTNVLSVNLTSLSPATSYTVQVRARDAATNIGPASSNSFTTPDTQAPTAPTGLSGSAPSSNTINLSWNASTDNVAVTGYRVYRNGSQIGNSATTSYSDGSVIGSTTYSYQVAAYDAVPNVSGLSNLINVTTPDSQPAVAVRVNVGGPAYTDAASNVWSADTGFNTGNALPWPSNTTIAGTNDPTLYRTERWDDTSAPEMTYSFNVPNGTYTVRLHFAENYDALFTVGLRVFDVNIQGALAFNDIDVFAEAGARTALIKTATATVTNGTLSIVFVHQVEDPFVNAIEVISQSVTPDTTPPSAAGTLTATAASATQINLSWGAATDNVGVTGYLIERCQGAGCSNFAQIATTTGTGTTYNNTGLTASTAYSYRVRARDAAANSGGYSNQASATTQNTPATVIRVNVGGGAYTDSGTNVWSADTGFNTGNALTWPENTAIAGMSDPTLYHTERWDDTSAPEMTYSFNVPNGTYTVRLHFAENYSPLFAVGQRVFDVNIQGALVFNNIDVFAEAGARTALIKTATATVTNGTLSITLVHQVEDPFINAIEILSQ